MLYLYEGWCCCVIRFQCAVQCTVAVWWPMKVRLHSKRVEWNLLLLFVNECDSCCTVISCVYVYQCYQWTPVKRSTGFVYRVWHCLPSVFFLVSGLQSLQIQLNTTYWIKFTLSAHLLGWVTATASSVSVACKWLRNLDLWILLNVSRKSDQICDRKYSSPILGISSGGAAIISSPILRFCCKKHFRCIIFFYILKRCSTRF